jgi:hypothetical protein
LVLYPKRYTHSHYLLFALCFYLMAKVLEHFDAEIFHLSSKLISGHTIKHVFAAIGSLMVLQMLRIRNPI